MAAVERNCLICGSAILRERGRAQSSYCSIVCANLVATVRRKAAKVVQQAISKKLIPPASSCICVDCGNSAHDYDHRRYLNAVEVSPVCRSCNLKRGPAEDVVELVAKYLGVEEESLNDAVHRAKEQHRAAYQMLLRKHINHRQISARIV